MADDSGKVVITLDLETGQATSNVNTFKDGINQLGSDGESSLGGLSLHFIAINEALELGQKALELWHKLLDSALEAEKIKNQETAFKAFAQSLGVDQEALTTAIEKASKGTVTHLQAMSAGMDLLQAGVNARDIPALTALATNIEATGRHGEKFADVIRAISTSAEQGSGRGLKQYDLIVNKVGDRQDVVNAILAQGQAKFAAMGDQVDVTNKKISARMDEAAEKTKLFFGGIASSVAFGIFGDETDKAAKRVSYLEDKLTSLKAKQSQGQEKAEVYDPKQGNQALPIAEAIAKVEAQIAENKEKVASANQKEAATQAEANDKLKDAKSFALELLPAQKANAEAASARMALEQRAAEEVKISGSASLKTLQDISAAKKAEIEKDFAQAKLAAESGATNEKQLAEKLVSIERDKFNKIQALRTTDDQLKKAQERAMENLGITNMRKLETTNAQHQKTMMDAEDKRYKEETEKLRLSGLSTDQLNKEVEKNEQQHQAKMKQIKDQFSAVNFQNFKAGIREAIAEMGQEYSSFSNMTKDVTKKSQGIMANSFVEAAKGHGNAMELMKTQFLEMIGTKMINEGTYMLLASLWPPDPIGAGAGAALIAAGSALVGASGSQAPTGGPGDNGGFMNNDSRQPNAPSDSQMNNTKQASIVIQGDFLNSRETANHLQDIIRQNSDTTDFAITAQGKSYS